MATSFTLRVAGVAMGVAAVLAACSTSKNDSGKIDIVASTNVWGDIAATVAGPDAAVTSLISDPGADPHSYELSPVEAAKVADAALVVYNGGGYDAFIDKALAGKTEKSVNAFESRSAAIENDENEHVWYDVNTVAEIAQQIATTLGELDPGHRLGYLDRANGLRAELTEISTITGTIAAEHPNQSVVQTEPLAHYLLVAAAADDRTPHEFQEAVEQGSDPSPASVATTRNLLTGKQVRALIYNVQTEGKITKELRSAAQSAGVPVVEVTETLPKGVNYVQWQTRNAKALAAALG